MTQEHEIDRNEIIQDVTRIVHEIRVAMFTTLTAEGEIRSRPLLTCHSTFDGDLWFLVHQSDGVADEVRMEQRVGISYACPGSKRYAALCGNAEVVDNPKKMETLWEPAYEQWFPDGLNTEGIVLLRVNVVRADYWDSRQGFLSRTIDYVKSAVTGQPPHAEEHKSIQWSE